MRAFLLKLRGGGSGWSVYDLTIGDSGPVIGEVRTGSVEGAQLTLFVGSGVTAVEMAFLHESIANL
jgi:hypothetical protein